MSQNPAHFVWYELMAANPTAAAGFYNAVVGWEKRESGIPEAQYWYFHSGNHRVAGMMDQAMVACEGIGSYWSAYVGVDDTDAVAAKIRKMGGTVLRPPEDIKTVGRFAVVADLHGAAFMLFTPAENKPAEKLAPSTPGLVGWRQLNAGNGAEAFEFYSELFGWQKMAEVDLGKLGTYLVFGDGEEMMGGIMTKMNHLRYPFWQYYFNVEDIHAALERIKVHGGQILREPHPLPCGVAVIGRDPQGAAFALVQPSEISVD